MPDVAFPAFVVRRQDDDVSTTVEELGSRTSPPGDVLVEVSWSSVNYKDAMATGPGNRVARISPLVPGVDLAGVVASSDDPGLVPGTEVLAHGHDLGVARHGGLRPPGPGCRPGWPSPAPDGLSARQAMVIGTAGFTAAMSLDQLEQRGLAPGTGPSS